MTDMYTSSFYNFKTEEERWSYWAKHINYLYNIEVKDIYLKLFKLLKDKNYFVITTNVDGQFLKAGFAKEKVFEVQGSLSKIQCAKACHNKLYNDLPLIKEMLDSDNNCQIPLELVPRCPVCKGKMDVNLRKNSFFVEDDNWYKLNNTYTKFINDNKNKRLVLLELGVGFNTPSIIRFPFENMTANFKDTTLIRVNPKQLDLVLEIKDKSILVDDDCNKFINKLSF